MIMFAFQCKCMAKCNPGRSKPRVHEWSFTNYKQLECDRTQGKQYILPEILSGLSPFSATQIPHSNRIPTNRIFRLPVDHLMRQNKEFRMEMRKMVHACNMQRHGLVVDGNKTKDSINDVKFERPIRRLNSYLEVIVKQSAQRKLE